MKRWILKRLLTPMQLMVLEQLEQPDRWMPDVKITPEEAKRWGETIQSSLGLKVDQTMINLAQMHAQRAVLSVTETPELQRAAGFAAGFRAAWQTVKALSVMFATKVEQSPEEAAKTGAATLDHLSP